MDFPADITLRKTRMKFELTFKVVLLFSYQGFAFMRKLLYFITSTFVCQELFSSFFNFFRSYLTFFFYLFQKKLFFYVVQLLYLITHVLSCQELFFIYLKIFFPISFKSMCSHVQRILYYHNNIITSSFFNIFLFCKKRRILYLFYNGARITS